MTEIFQVTALCVTGALLALVVKRGSPESALLLTLASAVLVLLFLLKDLESLLSFLTELAERSGVPMELFVPLYKTVGIALVVRLGGSLCRDAGETALGAVVETAGAICALLAALPLLRSVLSLLLELME
ncbi:SpoIIIAC/SpoIIIAD family protein [Oscillibacter sp.]|uniref:SpoIIIAC/SpoIIIAD family protein n=1 Tax=Oscillibacter sp. TaxID=1945593 RepID=UPI00260E9C26|nr:SpoIIIAC/SpoIIIAD family protein [Oscillibacter sp.]MDD3346328.1 SpoIIIAC/SpoIIIAD family protein [Oscillibacter sp.]